jgi:hypothetical protein
MKVPIKNLISLFFIETNKILLIFIYKIENTRNVTFIIILFFYEKTSDKKLDKKAIKNDKNH